MRQQAKSLHMVTTNGQVEHKEHSQEAKLQNRWGQLQLCSLQAAERGDCIPSLLLLSFQPAVLDKAGNSMEHQQ